MARHASVIRDFLKWAVDLTSQGRSQMAAFRVEPAFPEVPRKVIPGDIVQLPTAPLNVGGIGMCGRDVRKDGLCRLAPPLTCYPCEFFAAFRTGPHSGVLSALEKISEEMKADSHSRIPMQLEDVMSAIRQLLAQIQREKGADSMKHAAPAAEAAYVRQGRALFETVFPNAVFPFEAPLWDIRRLRTSQHKKTNSRIYFTLHGSSVDPLPPRLSNVVKAYIQLNRSASASMILRVDIARLLWEAVRPRFGEADAFDWGQLTEDDLLRTEQVMLIHWSQSTTYKRCTQLQYMMQALGAVRRGAIVRPMEVAFTTPRTDDSERYTLDGQVERMKRMPSDEAICAVADIYAR